MVFKPENLTLNSSSALTMPFWQSIPSIKNTLQTLTAACSDLIPVNTQFQSSKRSSKPTMCWESQPSRPSTLHYSTKQCRMMIILLWSEFISATLGCPSTRHTSHSHQKIKLFQKKFSWYSSLRITILQQSTHSGSTSTSPASISKSMIQRLQMWSI